jgi:hypothetical protein
VTSTLAHPRTFAVASFVAALSATACTVTELPPREPGPGHVAGSRQFRIECIHIEECREKASIACGSAYDVVSEWRNTIPESELPGLNEETRPKDWRDWNRHSLPDATGIESDAPMPLASIVVACAS